MLKIMFRAFGNMTDTAYALDRGQLNKAYVNNPATNPQKSKGKAVPTLSLTPLPDDVWEKCFPVSRSWLFSAAGRASSIHLVRGWESFVV